MSTGGSRRRGGLFGGRPTLQVDEYVPGIVLPDLLVDAPPVVEDDLEQDLTDEPELRKLDEQQRRYEEYVSGGGGLRVFLGNPLEREREARLSLPSNVEGLIWDASGLALDDEEEESDAIEDDDDEEFAAFSGELPAVSMLQMPVLRQVGVIETPGADEDVASPTAPPWTAQTGPTLPAVAPVAVDTATDDDGDHYADDEESELLPAEEAPEHAMEFSHDTPFERMAFSGGPDQEQPPIHSARSRGSQPLDSGTFDDPSFVGVDAVRRAFPSAVAGTDASTPARSAYDEQETMLDNDALSGGLDAEVGSVDEAPATDWRSLAAQARGQPSMDDSAWASSPTLPTASAPTTPPRAFDTGEGWFTKPPVGQQAATGENARDDDTDPSADRLDEEAELQSRSPAPLTTTHGSRIQWQRLSKTGGSASSDAAKAALSNKVALATEDRTLPSFRTYEPTAEPDVVKGAAGWSKGIWAVAIGLVVLILIGAIALLVGLGIGKGGPAANAPVSVTAPLPTLPPTVDAPASPVGALPSDGSADGVSTPDASQAGPQSGAEAAANELVAPPGDVLADVDVAAAAQADAEKAQARIRASGQEQGLVTVTSNVPAVVRIAGKVIGTTPVRMYALVPGTYEVRASAKGQTRVITSRVDAGRVMGLRFDF